VDAYQQVAALADPTRLGIFERLAGGPSSVVALARHFPVSRPAVSQHLRVLKGVGLVRVRADGNRRIYELDAAGVAILRTYFERFWSRALGAFQAAAERPTDRRRTSVTHDVTDAVVRQTVTVNMPVERAFALFTDGMATWWPESHHLGGVPAEMVLEHRAGGRIFDRYTDGREQDWARVIAFEPPSRFVFGWHLTGDWSFDPDPEHASTVEIRFIAESATRTRVDLEHRDFDRHGEAGDAIRQAVGSSDGWPVGLKAFEQAANAT
jgi:DNA-binding transcriptional ArsR family regulator/uncharacterized protein YndB with AHSA1/START domain